MQHKSLKNIMLKRLKDNLNSRVIYLFIGDLCLYVVMLSIPV